MEPSTGSSFSRSSCHAIGTDPDRSGGEQPSTQLPPMGGRASVAVSGRVSKDWQQKGLVAVPTIENSFGNTRKRGQQPCCGNSFALKNGTKGGNFTLGKYELN